MRGWCILGEWHTYTLAHSPLTLSLSATYYYYDYIKYPHPCPPPADLECENGVQERVKVERKCKIEGESVKGVQRQDGMLYCTVGRQEAIGRVKATKTAAAAATTERGSGGGRSGKGNGKVRVEEEVGTCGGVCGDGWKVVMVVVVK